MFTGLAGIIIFAFSAYAQAQAPATTPTPIVVTPAAPVAAPAAVPMPAGSSTSIPGNVNKKLNLEDITVKGELLSDDRMNFVRRQREELKNRIKFRTNFRPEILQEYKN